VDSISSIFNVGHIFTSKDDGKKTGLLFGTSSKIILDISAQIMYNEASKKEI
jgi:hypothetical protein